MQFERQDLIKRVEARIDFLKQKADADYDNDLREWKAEAVDWAKRYASKWQLLANNISAVLEKGVPLTAENCPIPEYDNKERYVSRGPAYVKRPEAPEYEPPRGLEELNQLLNILNADTSKIISQSALERVGFRKLRDMGLFNTK